MVDTPSIVRLVCPPKKYVTLDGKSALFSSCCNSPPAEPAGLPLTCDFSVTDRARLVRSSMAGPRLLFYFHKLLEGNRLSLFIHHGQLLDVSDALSDQRHRG
jgi:hypothetical protein